MTIKAIETMARPLRIGRDELIHEDVTQRLFRVVAEFDGFSKEYFVSDRGRRAAVVVARNEDVLLVRQYRLLIDGLSLEIPGGRVDDGETPEETAIRECREETGVECRNLRPLISFHLGLDTVKNPTYVYYTQDFTELTGEQCDRHAWLPLTRCVEMVFAGEICDSLSVIALLAYRAKADR